MIVDVAVAAAVAACSTGDCFDAVSISKTV